MKLSRRGILGAFLCAPAIIRTSGLLMPVVQRKPWLHSPMVVMGSSVALSPGDIITFEGVFARHIQQGVPLPELRQFVVTNFATNAISFYPAMDETTVVKVPARLLPTITSRRYPAEPDP